MEGLKARLLAGREAGLSAPAGLCFWQEDILVADMDNRRVVRLTPGGEVAPLGGEPPAMEKPLALAADAACVWVADAVKKTIWRWRAEEWEKVVSPGSLSPPLTFPGGLALSEEGNLYFTDFLTNRLCCRYPGGECGIVGGVDCDKPYGLCQAHGAMYLTDTARGRILRYAIARKECTVLIDRGEGWNPIALGAAGDGWLYISTGRTLWRFSLQQGGLEKVADPSSWRAMGLGKLCHLGAIAARPGRVVVSDTIRHTLTELTFAR